MSTFSLPSHTWLLQNVTDVATQYVVIPTEYVVILSAAKNPRILSMLTPLFQLQPLQRRILQS